MTDERPPLGSPPPAAEEPGPPPPPPLPAAVGLESSKMAVRAEKRKPLSPPADDAGGGSDDEGRPIGSLFKLKKPRVPKRPRIPAPEARSGNPRVDAEGDPGEMSDTLATFKKKLKGPKKAPEVKSQSKRSSKKNGGGETFDQSSDEELGDSLFALFQKGSSGQRARSVPKKLNPMERTTDTSVELSRRSGTLAGGQRSAPVGRSSSFEGGFSSVHDEAPPLSRQHGRKPLSSSPIAGMELGTGDDGLEGKMCMEGGFSLPSGEVAKSPVVKRRSRKARDSPIVETKVHAGVDEHMARASHGEGPGLVVKKRGRKPHLDRLADMRLVGAGADELLGPASHDGSLEPVVKRQGRKPRVSPIAVMDVGAGVDELSGRASHDGSLGLVVKRRGRKLRASPITEMDVGAGVNEHLTRASQDEGLVVKKRGRKPHRDHIADMKQLVAGVDELLVQVSHDGSLVPTVKRRGRKARHNPVPEGEMGLGGDQHFSPASLGGKLGPVVKQRGRKSNNNSVPQVEMGSGGDDHLGCVSHDPSLGLVVKPPGRGPHHGLVAEIEEVGIRGDEHLGCASNDGSLEGRMCVDDGFSPPDGGPKGLGLRRQGGKPHGNRIAELEAVVAGVGEDSDRISHDEHLEERPHFVGKSRSSLVPEERGTENSIKGMSTSYKTAEDMFPSLFQHSSSTSASEVKLERAMIDSDNGFNRYPEGNLPNLALSMNQTFSPCSDLKSKKFVTTAEGSSSPMGYPSNLNRSPNGVSKFMSLQPAEEETYLLQNGLKHCSNGIMSRSTHQVIEPSMPTPVLIVSADDTGFEQCAENLRRDILQAMSTSAKYVPNEVSSCTYPQQDSSSVPPLKMSEEAVGSDDVLDQSIDALPRMKPTFVMERNGARQSLHDDQLNDQREVDTTENTNTSNACLNLTPEEAFDKLSVQSENLPSLLPEHIKKFDELLGPSSENLKKASPTSDHDSQFLIPVQVDVVTRKEQSHSLSQGLTLPECHKKKDVHSYSVALNHSFKDDAIPDMSPVTSTPMQKDGNSQPDVSLPYSSSDIVRLPFQESGDDIPQDLFCKKEEYVHNSVDSLNQVAKDDPTYVKSPLNSIPMQTEDILQPNDALPQSLYSSHGLSFSDCVKKEKDAKSNDDGFKQPPLSDPISSKLPITSTPLQGAKDLCFDDVLHRPSGESLSMMTSQVDKSSVSLRSSLSGFDKKNKDAHSYNDAYTQPSKDHPISDESLVTSALMREEKLHSDNGLPLSYSEGLYVMTSQVANQSCLASTDNCQLLPNTGDPLNQIFGSAHENIQSSARSQNSVIIKERDAACSSINILDLKETSPVDAAMVFDHENTGNKSMVHRIMRNIKKRRQGDMAYEGDGYWDVLMHEQGFLTNISPVGRDKSVRTNTKSESIPDVPDDTVNGGITAVAAGLKACAAGPIEKIKFKELLKRKSGLKEYLGCRNMILDLWGKDVKHVLPLENCGVSDVPSEDELPRASLIREIYTFLDRNGYINAGIASEKEKPKPLGLPHFEPLKEFKPEDTSLVSIDSSKHESVSVLDEVRISENFAAVKNDLAFQVQNQSMLCTEISESVNLLVPNRGLKSSPQVKSEEYAIVNNREKKQPLSTTCETQSAFPVSVGNDTCLDDHLCNDVASIHVVQCSDAQGQYESATLKPPSTDPSYKMFDCGMNPIVPRKEKEASYDAHQLTGTERVNIDYTEKDVITARQTTAASYNFEYELSVCKRVIVIGAGPAGLAAARHLHRQGFSVTVLEARDRIGGRVYTDRSSLSVPVDLGASIITGVEADVATERRPDPSSLICSQLGLELTVLSSDCPLYDIVTGHKVSADLDEALEAEYNSLLDDMVLFVAQNGESAMKMSLEDGLEYALRRRRMVRSTSAVIDSDQRSKGGSDYGTVDTSMSTYVDTGTANNSDSGVTRNLLTPLERRVMDWHFANLEYGCAAPLKEVSLPYWNQDDAYGGFGGAHCMIRGGFDTVVENIGKGLDIHLNHQVTEVMYNLESDGTGKQHKKVKLITSNGGEFVGDAVLITVPLGCLKANTIKFSPALPEWKQSSIQRLGFGVLNKVCLEFPNVFWDDTVDYFGATSEETNHRGQCFMFWNVKKTVGAPVLIALVVGKAAIDGQSMSASDHVNHALNVLRKLFGATLVPNPVASVVTNWGIDPFSRGAYSYVAQGASGEDYDILGKPVENCLFFAGEATCKEHPDTVGGAMMSGVREAVRIIDILTTGKDCMAEVEAMEAVQRHSESERNEVRDMSKRLEACKLSHVLCKNSSEALITKKAILQDMFCSAMTTSGRLHLAKELLRLPTEALKSFAGTKEGLSTLNSWILDSLGKNATQLLRHCVRLLVLVSTDLLAVRFSGIGRTVKEKVCVHTSRDIRAIASQLVNMWIEVFRKEKAANGRIKLSRQTTASESSKVKLKNPVSGKQPLRITKASDGRRKTSNPPSSGSQSPSKANNKKSNSKTARLESLLDSKSEVNSSRSQSMIQGLDYRAEGKKVMSEEETTAFAAAEAARASALAAAEAYASSEAEVNAIRELPKIPSFHKFVRRDQYTQMDDSDLRRKLSGSVLVRQDRLSELDSRNCKVRNWSVDFTATCANFDNSKMTGDNNTQSSYSNEIACQFNLREHSEETVAIDSRLTKAWVDTDTAGSGVKDSFAIDRWQSQAMDADADFFSRLYSRDEEDSNQMLNPTPGKHQNKTDESSASQAAENKSSVDGQQRGAERIKQGVVDYVASLLMPLYKTKKIDKEGYKSILKKTATKVMDQCTEAEKVMTVHEFLDFRRKNKIRSYVDKLIERHMAMNPKV